MGLGSCELCRRLCGIEDLGVVAARGAVAAEDEGLGATATQITARRGRQEAANNEGARPVEDISIEDDNVGPYEHRGQLGKASLRAIPVFPERRATSILVSRETAKAGVDVLARRRAGLDELGLLRLNPESRRGAYETNRKQATSSG
ncbi:uncharacterized protein KD926_009010 [Aspergillus affinis]|uniref:uncharacterized protein n=1 Tax=Aspergillus affinis TaxID=1070780 RepID=UPI0022FE491C|nr:uncharacterized protein KD926_009010 [Aspergillus affinis]KAI9039909.1 hypothetical protein KD926_009010 [Aspergillus affinis]